MLLGHAVDGAHAPNERLAVDWNHSPIGKHALKRFDGARIIRVTKHGCEHDAIRDVEICIARR